MTAFNFFVPFHTCSNMLFLSHAVCQMQISFGLPAGMSWPFWSWQDAPRTSPLSALTAPALGPEPLNPALLLEWCMQGPCTAPAITHQAQRDRKWEWTERDLRAFFFAFLICWYSCRADDSAPFLGTTLSFGYQLSWSALAFSILLFIVMKGELGLGV